MRWRTRASVLLSTFGLLIGCEPAGDPAEHVSLDAVASQLRQRFNSDVGSVRVIMLASPT